MSSVSEGPVEEPEDILGEKRYCCVSNIRECGTCNSKLEEEWREISQSLGRL